MAVFVLPEYAIYHVDYDSLITLILIDTTFRPVSTERGSDMNIFKHILEFSFSISVHPEKFSVNIHHWYDNTMAANN